MQQYNPETTSYHPAPTPEAFTISVDLQLPLFITLLYPQISTSTFRESEM